MAPASDPTPPSDPGNQVAQYLGTLPTWDEFSPPLEDQSPAPTGASIQLPDDTLQVPVADDRGDVITKPVVYECTDTPYSMVATPNRWVTLSPDREVLWPGGLLQGRSYRDGIGSLLGLPISERAPLKVSIPSFATSDNFRLVETPDQAEVSQAIGSMIETAVNNAIVAPSTIAFDQRTFHSEHEFALNLGISGRGWGFKVSAKGGFERNASETTVTAHFVEKMFEVVVEPPQTPDGFFSAEFTADKLQQQIDLGKIGPDNLPVYVSNVVYGRMMTVAVTSTASEQDIRATLNVAFSRVAASGSAEFSLKQRKILQEATVAVASLGGDAEATIAMIRSGDWSQYFTASAPLSSAAPLSYTFRNLRDGSIAAVSETAEYTITECSAKASTSNVYEFLPAQFEGSALPAPYFARSGDVNGDGRVDLIWNHLRPEANQVVIGLANADGTFALGAPWTHPNTTEQWGSFTLLVGDLTGDGRADLVWNDLTAPGDVNKTWTAVSDGAGGFTAEPVPFIHPVASTGWFLYDPFIVDITGDGLADVVWGQWFPYNTRALHGATSNGDGTLAPICQSNVGPTACDAQVGPPGLPEIFGAVRGIGDVNQDGINDFIWIDRSEVQVALGTPTGQFGFPVPSTILQPSTLNATDPWTGFAAEVGGRRSTDVVLSNRGADPKEVVVIHSNADGTFGPQAPPQQLFPQRFGDNVRVHGPDVNGDGRADILWNQLGTANRVVVGHSDPNGVFYWTTAEQLHPTVLDWQNFDVHILDVNGDGLHDIVWNHPGSTNRIFVALARVPS